MNALRALRQCNAAVTSSSARPEYVWIDAMCIKQQDVAEGSAQVALMGSIFRSAKRTVVYLGEIDKHAKWMLKNVLGDDERTKFLSLSGRAKHWTEFFGRPWFTRTWIIQEVLNSTNELVVLLGSEELPWFTLEAANTKIGTVFNQNWNFVRESYIGIPKIVSVRDRLSGLIEDPHKSEVFTNRPTRFSNKPLEGMDIIDATMTSKHGIKISKLLYVLEATSSFKCVDGRDKLFAILPLFQTPIPPSLRPNYAKTMAEVYTDLSWYFINHNVPNVVQLLRHPDHDESLPSWVIDWRYDLLKSTNNSFMEQSDADEWQRIFKVRERTLWAKRDGQSLIVRGIVVSRIKVCNTKDWTVAWTDGTEHHCTAPRLVLPDEFVVFCFGFPYPFVLRQNSKGDWRDGYTDAGQYAWDRSWLVYAEKVQREPESFLTEFRIS